MDLRAYILGKRYSILQGNTFTEEYNETLDSATIIINNVEKIEDLRPYDDVFIFNFNADFNGYGEGITMPNPYYHFLVDQFTCEQLVLGENQYKYTIQLFSETKGLEVVQLPNISITQPLKASNKKTTINYLQDYVKLYSPIYKKVYPDLPNTYNYDRKYSLATTDLGNLKAPSNIFGANDYAPEMTLNNPNLRDILTQLMLTKDCIPVVKDDKIYCMEISKTTGTFDTSKGEINYVVRSRSSDNHCDNLKRTYQNALGQDNTCKYAEYLGFRNSDTGLMTLSNMRLETRFPIYKINKVLMCYYKRVQIVVPDEWAANTYYTYGATVMYLGKAYICIAGHTSSISTSPPNTNYWADYYAVFLCKQDISKLVLLNSYREALSQDYDDIANPSGSNVTTIDDLARYKFCTVGYDIGGKTITGWGTTYSQLDTSLAWFSYNKSYIENIINNMDKMYPFGIYNYGCIRNLLKENETIGISQYQGVDAIVVGSTYDSNNTVKIKSVFFQIEYDGFYNGTVVHSKDGARDNVVMNDNASGSLTLLEKDGFFEKEKANRFGNEAIQINARYTSLADLQPLGSVYDGNVIIYHREYSHYNNVINCTYYGTKDYVLKNYFTSVYSKHRPFNLLSYGETTTRSENRKQFVLLSKDKLYGQPLIMGDYISGGNPLDIPLNNKTFCAQDFGSSYYPYIDYITKLASAFNENAKATSKGVFKDEDVIDSAFVKGNRLVSKTDLNKFVCGKSMCFNLTMYDNLGGGSSLKQIVPTNLKDIYQSQTPSIASQLKLIFSNEQDDYTGTTTFYNNYNDLDDTTGRVDELSFMIGHKKYGLRYEDTPEIGNANIILNNIETDYLKNQSQPDWSAAYGRYGLYRLPNMENPTFWYVNYTNMLFTHNYFYKDNKEKLDMTFQIEPVTDDKDNIFFSEWFMKLNNLITTYHKTDITYQVVDSSSFAHKFEGIYGDEAYDTAWNGKKYVPFILMRIPAADYNYVNAGDNIANGRFWWAMCRVQDFFKYGITSNQPYIQDMLLEPKQIISISPTELKVLMYREINFAKGVFRTVHQVIDTAVMTLKIVNDANSKGYTAGYYTYKWNFEDNYNPFSPPVDGLSLSYDGTTYTFNQTSTGWFFCKGGGVLPLGNGGISTDEFDIQQMYFSTNSDETTTYNKNMFVAMSTNEIKEGDEEKEYSNYADIDGFSLTDNVGGRFTVVNDEYIDGHEVPVNHPCIMVNLFDLGTSSNIKSASFYFYDEPAQTYHFVFGVNISAEDLARGYIKIYINVLNTRDTRVFGADHLLAGHEKNFANVWEDINHSNIYGEYE